MLVPTLINYFHSITNNIGFGTIGIIIRNAINKAYYYLYWNEGGWATRIESSISNKVNRIFGIIFLVLIILSIIFIHIRDKSKNDSINDIKIISLPMIKYLYFMSLFALGCLTIKTGAFWRFEAVVVLFSPVILIQILEKEKNYKKVFNLIFLFAFTMFFINIIYALRNFDAFTTIINYISTSGIKILYELLKGIINMI